VLYLNKIDDPVNILSFYEKIFTCTIRACHELTSWAQSYVLVCEKNRKLIVVDGARLEVKWAGSDNDKMMGCELTKCEFGPISIEEAWAVGADG
jgi:hypothetical protein